MARTTKRNQPTHASSSDNAAPASPGRPVTRSTAGSLAKSTRSRTAQRQLLGEHTETRAARKRGGRGRAGAHSGAGGVEDGDESAVDDQGSDQEGSAYGSESDASDNPGPAKRQRRGRSTPSPSSARATQARASAP